MKEYMEFKVEKTPEIEKVAKNLMISFIAYQEDIGMNYALKKFGDKEIEDYWFVLAQEVLEDRKEK